MSSDNDTWTRAHDLALIYIALAYGTDRDLADQELSSITDLLGVWHDGGEEIVQEVVMEAMSIYLSGESKGEVARAIQSLGNTLTPEERLRALQDIVRIAEADGVLLTSERGLISVLASVWDLRAMGSRLLEETTVPTEDKHPWSLLHDIGLLYVVLAHSTDADLDRAEIAAIIERLGDWRPDLEEDQIRQVIREVLEVYAQEPDEKVFTESVGNIRARLSLIQLLVLLDDLVYIAEVDGELNQEEKSMIATLASAWHIGVRLNGHLNGAKTV